MTPARSTLVAFVRQATRGFGGAVASSVTTASSATISTVASSVAHAGLGSAQGRGLSHVSAAVAAAQGATVPYSFAASTAVPRRTAGIVFPNLFKTTAKRAFTTSALAPMKSSAKSLVAAVAAESTSIKHPLVHGGPFAEKVLGAWLVGGCLWVFSMVVLGGVTRLTRSGLSMTDWKFQWESPPLTSEDWNREFTKYKQSPEFKLTNKNMTVEEYKFIFWMEYGHRMWGRGLGVYFALPLVGFIGKGWITQRLGIRLLSFFGLGAAQGAIGWWMVKSGLVTDVDNPHNAPRVSPYRLATHLTGAFTIYTAMLWTTMGVLFPNVAEGASEAATTVIRKTRAKALPLSALIAITALSGAYVAGMDAGRAYNTFPLMDGQWVPEEYLKDFEKLGWRNFFENTAAVQFDHRVLAMSTLIVSTAVWASSRGVLHLLPPRASLALNSTVVLVYAQVGLGIATLLNHVPVSLGVLHQANALLVFTAAVGLVHALRRGGGRAAQAARRSVTQKNAGVGSAVHAKPR